MSKIQVNRSSSSDWTSLLGLLMLTGLTGISTFVMVVDVSALRQMFQPDLPTPGQYEIAKQLSQQSTQP
ncbi:MAG: hypothetical protein AAGI45_10775 [Cyanobacteria bacterium P01_H01_bin.26]